MKDQAEQLRRKMNKLDHPTSTTKTMAVVSGKGGVGKSNFSLNFAISLISRGHKVLLFDMDIGMGNIDILLGNSARYTIVDFFEEREALNNIISEGPAGLHYIAGGTGLERLLKLEGQLIEKFTEELTNLLEAYDYVIFDMGAGATQDTLKFILSVDEIIVVTTPEPTSITDAYAMMKHIHLQSKHIPFYMVVNRVQTEKDGEETFKRLRSVSRRFLDREIKALGFIPDDQAIRKAVISQTPFIFNEKASASKALAKITDRYEEQLFKDIPKTNAFRFVSKLKRFLFER